MIWSQIGERVEKIRKEKKLSKSQFGKMIGVTGQYIGMIERGTQKLSVNSIVKICQVSNTSADYIIFGIADSSHYLTTTTALEGLSNEQIQIALDIVRKVAQFINTDDGNEALIQEVLRQQHTNTKNIEAIDNEDIVGMGR